jgi:hypothetical protein
MHLVFFGKLGVTNSVQISGNHNSWVLSQAQSRFNNCIRHNYIGAFTPVISSVSGNSDYSAATTNLGNIAATTR